MKRTLLALAAVSLLASAGTAAPCKDAKGKFTKCPPAAAAATPGVTRDKNGKCHAAAGPNKGKFVACPK